ncbi:hypothetical protein [Bradyrhizobium sp. USDA 4353]
MAMQESAMRRLVMRRRWLRAGQALVTGLILNSSVTAASADAARCTSKADVDTRIAGCTMVIAQGQSAARQVIKAHLARASAYFQKGDLDHAIDDYRRVIVHVSADLLTAYNRAPDQRGGEPLPLVGTKRTPGSDSDRARAYRGLGIASFQAGLLEQSQDEFRRLSAIDPGNAEVALWLDLARRRAGQASELAAQAKQLDMKKWPAPLVRFFLGKESIEAVFAAADGSPALRRTRRCEASFFAGELMLQQNHEAEAIKLMDQALAGCPLGSDLRSVATAEARVLSVVP